jgi:hypothetical protein
VIVVEQADLAHVSDSAIRRIVVDLCEAADLATDAASRDLWRRLAVGMVRAHRLRRSTFERMVLVYELEVENDPDDDAEGELVVPDVDPVADALDELRRKIRGGLG